MRKSLILVAPLMMLNAAAQADKPNYPPIRACSIQAKTKATLDEFMVRHERQNVTNMRGCKLQQYSLAHPELLPHIEQVLNKTTMVFQTPNGYYGIIVNIDEVESPAIKENLEFYSSKGHFLTLQYPAVQYIGDWEVSYPDGSKHVFPAFRALAKKYPHVDSRPESKPQPNTDAGDDQGW